MSRILLTFSGKHGDIIWSFQAARALSAAVGHPVDFGVMPLYKAVVPLALKQPYIDRAFAIEGWEQYHDKWGAQPAVPPILPMGYDIIHHLSYEYSPQEPLIMWGLRKLGLPIPEPQLPFLFSDSQPEKDLVTYAFNGQFRQQKLLLLAHLHGSVKGARWQNVERLPFDQAAERINAARFFFGCRSANYVIAMGLNKRVLTFELDPGRREDRFGCPGSREHMPHPDFRHQFVDLATQWMEED